MDWRRRLARWRGRPSAGVWVAVLVVVGLAVLAGCVYVLPQMLVPHRSAASLAAVADAAKRLELEDAGLEQRNDVRTTLLQGLAGAVVAVGLSLTWRQIRVNQEGQITERFNKAIDKAIDHLGSDKLDLRLGGIYALQRIAKNSSADRDTIAEILTAFVRQRSPWPPSQPGQYRDDFPVNRQPQLRTRAADIQAVLTVLGQGGFTREGAMALDLAAVDLRRALLPRARLDGANLIDARLQGAILIDAQLQGTYLVDARLQGASLNNAQLDDASLIGAWLQGAILEEAHLDDADLRNAHLEGAYLRRAHLEGADLTEARLDGADLRDAQLDRANLCGARLDRADLRVAQLDGAVCDVHTTWPDGFDISAKGIAVWGELPNMPKHEEPHEAPDIPNW